MKNKSNMVYYHLCADCYRKLNTLYRLHDVPLERQRGGRGKCGLCDFRGELTEIEYDRVKDKRSPEEPAPAPKDYGFTRQTFLDLAALDKL